MVQGILVLKFEDETILPDIYEMNKKLFEDNKIIKDMTFVEVNRKALDAILKIANTKGTPYKAMSE